MCRNPSMKLGSVSEVGCVGMFIMTERKHILQKSYVLYLRHYKVCTDKITTLIAYCYSNELTNFR